MVRTPDSPRRTTPRRTRRSAPVAAATGPGEGAATEALAGLVEVMARLDQAYAPGAGGPRPVEGAPEGVPDEVPDGQAILDALGTLRRLREQLATWEPALIEAARAQGLTWTEIAPALGLASRQAAERRFLRLNPQAGDQAATTREQRVQTTRDRRSGDRAVAAWARANAAQLRELAGQISALPVRDQGGRATREAIHTALGHDDAAALLAPLRATEPALRRKHRALAERVSSLGETTIRIRNADRSRRNPAARPSEVSEQRM
ncbi:hypothetical protein ACWDWO_21720 [Actinopolymorpha singaporensis]